ncbi:anhydro-N-acetylmuramic acid kinase [Marinimicrobium sp. C2-29]|uniref:anhydro-N-acetylmuramic acid kinase n=1 Tax=Marinimicrobium sp. C2-29 TaxID=3139825 RepID=UPI00313860B2
MTSPLSMASELYIGLMSGTSADAIDAVLVDFSEQPLAVLASHSLPLDRTTRAAIKNLTQPGTNEIDRLGMLDHRLGNLFARAVNELLQEAQVEPSAVAAIGSHGQTLRHRPPGVLEYPFSLQVGDPNIIAQQTGITTVADFRRRDLAAGGQGAPLVPAFHQAIFRSTERDRAIVNVGGIANVTWLPTEGETIGFDTGPGNGLMDAWINQIQGKPYDDQGQWAASGEVNAALLARLLAHSYFRQPPPKSTGPEDFHYQWLTDQIAQLDEEVAPEDVQATLLILTAQTIAASVEALQGETGAEIYLCGGGAYNQRLREALTALLPNNPVEDTGALGLAPEWIEATAFAWLARQTQHGLPGNLPSVTGASEALVLGAIYPGMGKVR